MVAGVSQLASSDDSEVAQTFINYLLSESAQAYFSSETYEYPLVSGVAPSVGLTPLADLNAITIDLADLADIQGTIALLQEVAMLP
jgi:iron(III) transport system substrate-binding protein